MANKFLSNINLTAGLEADGDSGSSGQILTSTDTGVAWVSPETISSESAEHVQVLVKNTSGATIAKGTPVYVTGETGNSGKIEIAPADSSDSAKMPALGLLLTSLNDNGEGYCVTGGLLESLATGTIDGVGSTANDTVYVKPGGGLTLTKPTGSGNLIQNVAKVARVHASNGSLIVSSILRTNDVPNLPTGKIWVGNGSTIVSDTVFLDEPNGRMGIGTTSPSEKLTVTGNIQLTDKANSVLFGSAGGDGTWGAPKITRIGSSLIMSDYSGIQLGGYNGSSYGARMVVKGTGEVGIGTDSPSVKLEVNGGEIRTTRENVPANYLSLSTTSAGSFIKNAGGTSKGLTFDNVSATSPYINFKLLSSEAMRITSAGNVGIGTTSPDTPLHIYKGGLGTNTGVTDMLRIELNRSDHSTTPSGPAILFKDQDTNNNTNEARIKMMTVNDTDYGDNDEAASNLLFETTNNGVASDKMIITGRGNVGIGTTSPSEKLEVTGNVILDASNARLKIKGGGNGTNSGIDWTFNSDATQYAKIELDYDTRVTTGLLIDSGYPMTLDYSSGSFSIKKNGTSELTVLNGNVGIGTTSPNNKLDVVSSDWVQASFRSTGSGYAPASILLEAGDSSSRGQGVYNYNSPSKHSWFSGVPYSTSSDDWVIAHKLETIAFNPDVAQMSNALLSVKANGNVGIGTTSPVVKLQVDGTITSTGVLTAYTSVPSINIGHNGDSAFIAATSGSGANSPISFSVGNNNEKMRITSAGNVGIGTTSPTKKLEVNGTVHLGSSGNDVSIGSSSSSVIFMLRSGYNYIQASDASGALMFRTGGSNNRMIITSAGNVGIGTTSPSDKLDVSGRVVADAFRTDVNTGHYSVISRSSAGNPPLYVQSADSSTDQPIAKFFYGNANPGQGSLVLNVGKDKSYFTNTNVGIGTTSPGYKLDVRADNGDIGQVFIKGGNSTVTAVGEINSELLFGSNDASVSHGNIGGKISSVTEASNGAYTGMAFYTYRQTSPLLTEKMRITNNGNVGIGTTSPSQKLHVNGSAIFSPVGSTTPTLDLVSYNGSSDPFTRYYDESNGPSWCTGLDVSDEKYKISFDYDNTSISTSTKLVIDTAGNVGIGTTSPSQKLHVAGNMRLQNQLYDSTNSAGTNGEVLTKVSAGTEWKVPAVNAQMPDNTAPASAANVGTLRYRTSGNNSYVDMCMQTGASTYAWVNIVQNNW